MALAGVLAMALIALAGQLGLRSTGSFVIERAQVTSGGEEGDALTEGGGDSDDEAPQGREPAPVVVHIDGAVRVPGVYALEGEDPRVNDAVAQAGGLNPDADTQTVNLAAPLADGEKIHIPVVGEAAVADQAAPVTGAADVGTPGASGMLVNINTATSQELQGLTGVGEATAAAILEDRERNGAFSAPEDLMRVSGIGEKKYEKIRDRICV